MEKRCERRLISLTCTSLPLCEGRSVPWEYERKECSLTSARESASTYCQTWGICTTYTQGSSALGRKKEWQELNGKQMYIARRSERKPPTIAFPFNRQKSCLSASISELAFLRIVFSYIIFCH